MHIMQSVTELNSAMDQNNLTIEEIVGKIDVLKSQIKELNQILIDISNSTAKCILELELKQYNTSLALLQKALAGRE